MELKNICKSFDGKTVLHDVSIKIEKGDHRTGKGTLLLRQPAIPVKPDSGTDTARPPGQFFFSPA